MFSKYAECQSCGMRVLATPLDMADHSEFHRELQFQLLEKYNINFDVGQMINYRFMEDNNGCVS